MKFSHLLYKLIYQPNANFALRNLNKYLIQFIHIGKLKLPPSGIFLLFTNSGTIKIATNQTSHISKLLYWQGYAKFEYSVIIEKLAQKLHYFLDVGSNIGYYALLVAKANPNVKIYSFEPAKGPGHFLRKNIILNKLNEQIIHCNLALARQEGEIAFYEVKSKKYPFLEFNLSGEHNAGTKKNPDMFIKTMVKSQRLDVFVENEGLKQIDLIKLDTEGTEIHILNSGIRSIKQHRPIIICEILFNVIESELEVFFKNLEYLIFIYFEGVLKEVDSILRDKDDGIRNCFFVPPSKIYLIEEFIK